MPRPLRLLTVGHSYTVALNRRLAHELAREGGSRWQVTCAAPAKYHADLGLAKLAAEVDEPCALESLPAYLTSRVHAFTYGLRAKQLLQQDWDIVHGWEEPYILAGYELAKWSRRSAKFVFWTMQNIAKRYPPPFSWFEREVVNRADGWLYTGGSVRETRLGRVGYADKPSLFAPIGVDVRAFHPDDAARRAVLEQLGWSGAAVPVVGYVGRFVPEKGLRMLARALDRCAVPFRVLFLGDGPLAGELRSWAANRPDHVRFVRARHEDVPTYLRAMDVLCAPSQTTPKWREQFGRMLTEAMACGVPVMGSDSGEIPHVIGDAGMVLPEADETAWTRALEQLLGDSGLRIRLSERGLSRVAERYQWPVIARQHLEFFERLLD